MNTSNYYHYCKDNNYEAIDADSLGYEKCTCEIDCEGKYAEFNPGDRVYVHPMKQEATVIKQILHYDMNDSFWGNLQLQYDDGIKGISHSWQCERVKE